MTKRITRAARAAQKRKAAKVLRASRKAEATYVRRLRALARGYLEDIAKAATFGLKRTDAFRTRAHDRVEAKIREIKAPLATHTRMHVKQMFEDVSRKNAFSLKSLGVPIQASARVVALLPSIQENNVSLITKNVEGIAEEMLSILTAPENIGLETDALAELIQERIGVGESRAILIARDQTTKLNGAINEARQRDAGVKKYQWSTSGDERVREEHQSLDGETFGWDAQPTEGHPGDAVMCRCVAIPIVEELEGLDL